MNISAERREAGHGGEKVAMPETNTTLLKVKSAHVLETACVIVTVTIMSRS